MSLVYQPSIYTYTCNGAYFASSDKQGSEGVCRGLRTRLELLSDMEPDTREGAIKRFTYMTDYEIDDDDAHSLNQKTKSILVSPALIYKEKPQAQAQAQQPPSNQLPEEELIKRQNWSCYGSTEVEYLVLRNESTGDEHIAAVAPRNMGVSIRKIEADEGSITSIGFGWLNIVVDSGPSFMDDEEEDEQTNNTQQKPQQQKQQQGERQKLQPQNHHAPNQPIDEIPPRPSTSTLDSGREFLKQVYNFSLKVGDQMQANASWLYENVQDDFSARSVAAGQKIFGNVPKTAQKTADFMGRILSKWTNGGDGDEPPPPSSGGGPPAAPP